MRLTGLVRTAVLAAATFAEPAGARGVPGSGTVAFRNGFAAALAGWRDPPPAAPLPMPARRLEIYAINAVTRQLRRFARLAQAEADTEAALPTDTIEAGRQTAIAMRRERLGQSLLNDFATAAALAPQPGKHKGYAPYCMALDHSLDADYQPENDANPPAIAHRWRDLAVQAAGEAKCLDRMAPMQSSILIGKGETGGMVFHLLEQPIPSDDATLHRLTVAGQAFSPRLAALMPLQAGKNHKKPYP